MARWVNHILGSDQDDIGGILSRFEFDTTKINLQRTNGETKISYRHEQRVANSFSEQLSEQVGLDMVEIPGGSFLMGSPGTEEGRANQEGPQHGVEVSPFFITKYPVTQAQWRVVADWQREERDLDPELSYFKGDDRPVEQVSWFDTVEFCKRLARQTARDYRLPSEAEWEYACRANSVTPFHFGETITTELANYDGSYSYGSGPKGIFLKETTPVGFYNVANEFGLYDMHGNIFEWCSDPWHGNYENAPTNGSIWEDSIGSFRLLRGGSWGFGPRICRSANRRALAPVTRFKFLGFRVCCVLPR